MTPAPDREAQHLAQPDRLVLVHGLWMHGAAFVYMRWRLRRQGFDTCCFSYPSVRRTLDDNARALARFIATTGDAPVHLLAHSLGGIVVLRMMALQPTLPLARVVLMGSPVQGSHVARVLCRFAPTSALIGRSMRSWNASPAPAGPLTAEVGVIAGDRGIGVARLIKGIARPNDGVVAVAETELPGASDQITLRVNHSEMLVSTRCAQAAGSFLRRGRFSLPGD